MLKKLLIRLFGVENKKQTPMTFTKGKGIYHGINADDGSSYELSKKYGVGA